MKILSVILVFLSMICILVSHAEGNENLVRNDLIDIYGLPDGEYLDDFISEFSLTNEYLELVDIQQVFNNYLLRRYVEDNDYSYLLNVSNNRDKGAAPYENISKILWFRNPGNLIYARLFDLESKKLLYGDFNFLSDISKAETRDINYNEIDSILKGLSQFDVINWEESYSSSINNTTGYLFWLIVIEYSDGTYFVSYGSGSNADNLPETYSQVLDLLQIT